jgi:hypothetical protein
MSILFSGDFHAGVCGELHGITKKSIKQQYGTKLFNDIRYHIILGDGGFMWLGDHKTDDFNYKVLAYRPFPVLCVIGNHEPILGMNNIPEIDIGIGETVYQIHDKPLVAYLKRGKVYIIDGFKMLVLGGALSIDKNRRTPGKSWWKEEYWSEQEKQDVLKLLETENAFDCVLSHTGPHTINQTLFYSGDFDPQKYHDEVALLNDRIRKLITFKKWWCGHWHQDTYYTDAQTGQEFYYLYRTTKILEKKDGHIIVHKENGHTHPSHPFQKKVTVF